MSLNLVDILIFVDVMTFEMLLKAPLAISIHLFISLSHLPLSVIKCPRYINLLTCSIALPLFCYFSNNGWNKNDNNGYYIHDEHNSYENKKTLLVIKMIVLINWCTELHILVQFYWSLHFGCVTTINIDAHLRM